METREYPDPAQRYEYLYQEELEMERDYEAMLEQQENEQDVLWQIITEQEPNAIFI